MVVVVGGISIIVGGGEMAFYRDRSPRRLYMIDISAIEWMKFSDYNPAIFKAYYRVFFKRYFFERIPPNQ